MTRLRARIVAREGVGAEQRYFYFKPLWQRALVVVAGPAINFIFSIALFAVLLLATMGEPVASMKVLDVDAGLAGGGAGFQAGRRHHLGRRTSAGALR